MRVGILFLFSILCCSIFGFVLYAITNDWIIINFPGQTAFSSQQANQSVKRKIIKLIFWHNKKWNMEKAQIIWSDKTEFNTNNLLNCWLNFLDEEGIMRKKVTVQSVSMNDLKTECFVSFDQAPFSKEDSTFEKLIWMESLLKTLRENEIQLQGISFLVHHKPIGDNHLDFTNPWPIEGFLT